MICVDRNDASRKILVISENGFGKKTLVNDENGEPVYRITNRGGKGIKTINITEKTGKLVGILDVGEKEDLIITCQSGITLRTSVESVKLAGRNTQGVILIRLDEGDSIAAISQIEERDEEEHTDEQVNTEPTSSDDKNDDQKQTGDETSESNEKEEPQS